MEVAPLWLRVVAAPQNPRYLWGQRIIYVVYKNILPLHVSLQAVRQDMCAINFCTCRFGFRGRDQSDGRSKCVVQIASLCMQLPLPHPELQDVAKIMQVVRLPLLPVLY